MKKRKRKIILLIIIVFILIIFLLQIKKNKNDEFQDELIFFKLFSFGTGENENTLLSKNQSYQQYNFQVSYKNIDFRNIYLSDTINQKTLINEKVAPRNRR